MGSSNRRLTYSFASGSRNPKVTERTDPRPESWPAVIPSALAKL